MIDIHSIIAAGDGYNLHSHTEFCDGRAPLARIVEAASEVGFTTWGISPHAPIDVESPCNMSTNDVARYKAEVDRLRRQYPAMTLLTGMEVDYLTADCGPASKAVSDYGLDYVIGSVHFVTNQHGVFYDIDGSPARFVERLATVFEGDLDYVVRTFWSQTMDMIAHGGLDIIGHIDKIARNATEVRPRLETEPAYRAMADAAVRAAVEAGLAIEINTKQRDSGRRFFPHPRHWAFIARSGTAMPINSDAHTTEGVDAFRTDAKRLLRAITTLDTTPETAFTIVTANDSLATCTSIEADSVTLRGATVAARNIDRDTAAVLAAAGVRQVYTDLITEEALEVFAPHPDIYVDFDKIRGELGT